VGRFRSIYQFCEKVDIGCVNRRMIESLIRAGAMDSLEGTRARIFVAVESAMEAGQRVWRDRESGQTGLFGMDFGEEPLEKPLPQVKDWTPHEQLQGEKELLGFYVTGHPLDQHNEKICELATHDTGNLEGLEKGKEVVLCGVLTGIQRRRNKEQKPWASMRLEDRNGSVDAMVFTTQFDRLVQELVEDRAVMVRAQVLPEENGPPKLSVQDMVPLDVARIDLPSIISVKVWLGRNGLDRASELQQLFARKPGDTQVRLRLEMARDFAVIVDVPQKVRPDREFHREVQRICGGEAIETLAT
jgi:DNA polymerase-3 subunit alpha